MLQNILKNLQSFKTEKNLPKQRWIELKDETNSLIFYIFQEQSQGLLIMIIQIYIHCQWSN